MPCAPKPCAPMTPRMEGIEGMGGRAACWSAACICGEESDCIDEFDRPAASAFAGIPLDVGIVTCTACWAWIGKPMAAAAASIALLTLTTELGSASALALALALASAMVLRLALTLVLVLGLATTALVLVLVLVCFVVGGVGRCACAP